MIGYSEQHGDLLRISTISYAYQNNLASLFPTSSKNFSYLTVHLIRYMMQLLTFLI